MELQTTVQAIPPIVTLGVDAVLDVNINASEATNLLLNLEVRDPSMAVVHTATLDDVNVDAGIPRSVPFVWTPPPTTAEGTYTVSLGVFKAHWELQYAWYAGVTTFAVSTSVGTGFSTAATVSPEVVLPGDEVEVDVEVTSATTTTATVDIDLIRTDGTVMWPRSFPLAFTAGVPVQIAGTWDIPEVGSLGTYRVRVTIRDPGQPPPLHLDPSAGTVKVRSTLNQPTIKVELKTQQTSASTYQPSPELEIHNISDDPIALTEVSARYYFTIETETEIEIGAWTSGIDRSNVVLRIVKMPIPSTVADHYLEVAFGDGAGMLAPGSSVGIHTWLHRKPWSVAFDQSNDHSFVPSTALVEAVNVTAYRSEQLVWGEEPTRLDLPPFPTPIAATPSNDAVALSWTAVPGASGYDVRADGTTIEDIPDATFEDGWLTPGTRHTYRVRTRRDGQLSVWSAPLTLSTTGGPAISAPVDLRIETNASTIALSWRPSWETVTGYDVEIDGTIVVDAGAAPSFTHSGLAPAARHYYRVRARNGLTTGAWSRRVRANTRQVPTGAFSVSLEIDPTAERSPISRDVYGTNAPVDGVAYWTARRMGGNRLSTYNWVNNASNAGDDYEHRSDGYVPMHYGEIPTTESQRYDEPAVAAIEFHNKSRAMGARSLIALQTAGYAAADRNGVVSPEETAPSSRWVAVTPAKGAPFTLTPDLTGGTIYMDEYVNFLVHAFGDASTANGITGYQIDNEPALWKKTHPWMHPAPTTSAEVLDKSIALTKAVKDVDPHAKMFGPVSYGFSEFYDMQGAADWADVKGNYEWYIDYYLDRMRIESAKDGRRLLDVLDLHWYPEIKFGGANLPLAPSTNDAANRVRVQAPRSLWDASYREASWFADTNVGFLPMIPRLQRSIDTHNAGTLIAFSEYSFGAEDHVSGGIAVADALGIFGRHGVHLATFWKLLGPGLPAPTYAAAAFEIFNGYDDGDGRYGDVAVRAETSDIDNSSVYGAVHQGDDGRLHLIVINKNFDHDMTANIHIEGDTIYGSASVWKFDANSPTIAAQAPITGIENNTLSYAVPKLTVCHFVLEAETT